MSGSINIRLAAAVLYVRNHTLREGWEDGPSTEQCSDRFLDEVSNLLDSLGIEDTVESISKWINEHDEEIRAAAVWRPEPGAPPHNRGD